MPSSRISFGRSLLARSVAALTLTAIAASAQDVAWAYVDPVGEGASFTPDPARQYTTSGGAVTVDRDPAQQNRFTVVFEGMSPSTGVVLASACDGNHTAVVKSWSNSGGDVRAVIELFDAAGGRANDGKFTATFRRGGDAGLRQAYLWANDETNPAYTPLNLYSWNGNRADPTIVRMGPGDYEVDLPGLAATGFERGHVQVAPYGDVPRRANVLSWSSNGVDAIVRVQCYDMAGTPADAEFVLGYNETVAPISELDGSGVHVWAGNELSPSYEPDARYTFSNGRYGPQDAQKIERLGVGAYRVELPSVVPVWSATAQVTAYGSQPTFATIGGWTHSACGGSTVLVDTFDAAGNPADSRFTLQFLTNRPAARPVMAWAFISPAGQGPAFSVPPGWRYSTVDEEVTVNRDPGQQNRFFVRFHGVGSSHGIVHASAFDGNHTAVVNGWNQQNDDVVATVELFAPNGGPADDERFFVRFRRGGNNRDREAYVWASSPANPSYTPPTDYSWNADRGSPSVTRVAIGTYAVTLPGLEPAGTELGHVQVTAYANNNLRAKITGWSSNGTDMVVGVRTTNSNGILVDGRFVMSYNETAAPISEHDGAGGHVWAAHELASSYSPAVDYTDSNGTVGPANSEFIERLGTGTYRVSFPDLSYSDRFVVQATAFGGGAEYANVDGLASIPGANGSRVIVKTFDASGNAADAQFTLLFLSSLPATGAIRATSAESGSSCNGPMLAARNRPVSCTTWELDLTGIPAAAVFGFLQLDVTFGIGSLGANAPGCVQHTGGAATVLLPLPVPGPVFALDIPADPSFVGVMLYAQGGAFVPGINNYGLAASNAVVGMIGDI